MPDKSMSLINYTTTHIDSFTKLIVPRKFSFALPIYFCNIVLFTPLFYSFVSVSFIPASGMDYLRVSYSSYVEARFTAPVHTGPGAHPASSTKDTGLFPEVKRLGCGVNHPPSSSAGVKVRVELYLYSHLRVFISGYRVNFTYLLTP